VSSSQPVSEAYGHDKLPAVADPRKNPAYPQRTHLREKPHWQGILKTSEDRLADARQRLDVLGNDANRPAFERIYAQMLGARDQVADAVKRLPQETGDLYEEDHHRVDDAVAALDLLFRRWESQTTTR